MNLGALFIIITKETLLHTLIYRTNRRVQLSGDIRERGVITAADG